MKHILLLGASGHLGLILIKLLLGKGYFVVALVRTPEKITIQHRNLTIIKGDVTNTTELSKALEGIDVVISTLGHGFRTSFPIQERTLTALLPLMEKKHIDRFITVTGAGLKVKGDPSSLIGTVSEILFPIIDPYRMSDAKAQLELLEVSTINWTVVRTPVHNSRPIQKIKHVGFSQPQPWYTLSRHTVCEFIIQCIEENTWDKKSPIIY